MRKVERLKKRCRVCEKGFEVLPSKASSTTCSRKCCGIYMGALMTGHRPYHWKGGGYKHKGYVLVLAKDHPSADRDGYIYEHRLVMEKHIGRLLKKGEVVHHINQDRADNRIANLELVASQAEHMRLHSPKGTHIYTGVHPRLGTRHTEKTKELMKQKWREWRERRAQNAA